MSITKNKPSENVKGKVRGSRSHIVILNRINLLIIGIDKKLFCQEMTHNKIVIMMIILYIKTWGNHRNFNRI